MLEKAIVSAPATASARGRAASLLPSARGGMVGVTDGAAYGHGPPPELCCTHSSTAMGIALGLAAAFAWGLNDYFVALAARRTGVLRTVLGFHVIATALLAAAALGTGALDGITATQVAVLGGVGVLGAVAYLLFFGALAIGPISIVSPIMSAYAAVTVLLAVFVLGERLSAGQTLAVIVAMLGVLLASTDLRALRTNHRAALAGVVLAVAAMVWIGGFVFGISYYTDDLGWLAPIFVGRGFSTLLLVLTALRGAQWRFPERSPRLLGLIALVGILDTLGYVAFNLGAQRADTSLVATASTPYAVVPVVMGVALLGERPAPNQWVGVALVIAGLVILGLVS